MKLAVFAYNFPHKKTQDFLIRLFLEGYRAEFVVACEPIKLNLPRSILRVKPNHIDLLHPELICRKLNIPYYVLAHNSIKVVDLLKVNNIEVGIIAGARILKTNIIQAVSKGIINFHPGLIPEASGLDALKRAIYYGLPIGVTAHFIDERIDAGRIILKQEIPLRKDDTLIDLSLRLAETQTNMLPKVLEMVSHRPITDFSLIPESTKINPPITAEMEKEIPKKLAERLQIL